MYINIHTHHIANIDIEIENSFLKKTTSKYTSYGLHPWYIDSKNFEIQLAQLQQLLLSNNCIALGEIGIDTLCNIEMPLQEKMFEAQIVLANTYSKPIIIHNVQSHERILYLLNKNRNSMPAIFHGFNNNIQIAKQITNAGNYISLGKAILNNKSNAFKILPQLALDKIFLETDDTIIDIEVIYNAASDILNITNQQLQNLIMQNFNSIFDYLK
jgi:TatD DNase family protein